MSEQEGQRGIPKSEWLTVAIFVGVQVFSFGGFFYTVTDKLGNISSEMHELNKTVGEGQVVMGKIVEHLSSVDRRLDSLEARRKD